MVFCLITGIDTYGSQHPWGVKDSTPQCPLGYLVWLCAIPLILGNYWLAQTSICSFFKTWLSRVLSPCLFTVLVGWCVSWLNFRTPLLSPPFWQMLGFALFLSPSFVSSVIRYYSPYTQNLININPKAAIAWIEGNSNMWRTLAVTGVAATFAFVAFCLKANYDWNSVLNEPHRGIANALMTLLASGITLYVFLGPIYECFLKEKDMRNMLLDIKMNKGNQ
jgi:hypothetical protein